MSSSSEEGELPAVQNVLQKNFFFRKIVTSKEYFEC